MMNVTDEIREWLKQHLSIELRQEDRELTAYLILDDVPISHSSVLLPRPEGYYDDSY